MAYMSQEKKKELAPAIKNVLKEYGMKGTIGVENHSAIVVRISGGPLNILENYLETSHRGEKRQNPLTYLQVNDYWIGDHYTDVVKEFLLKLKSAMMTGNHNNSDIQSDYFDVGWYLSIQVGQWNKPYNYQGAS